MSRRTLNLTDELYEYLLSVSLREDALLARLREETARLPAGGMQIAPEQGQLLQLLCELIGARRALEVGTFTGYSSICIARALGPEGTLVCCDTSVEWTNVARRYWAEAGLDGCIELRVGPARDTLDALVASGAAASFDFAFVDADKERYEDYVERCLTLVRPGGVVAVDNVLWGGAVLRDDDDRPTTRAIRRLNSLLHEDGRVSLSVLPIGDGLTVLRRRG